MSVLFLLLLYITIKRYGRIPVDSSVCFYMAMVKSSFITENVYHAQRKTQPAHTTIARCIF